MNDRLRPGFLAVALVAGLLLVQVAAVAAEPDKGAAGTAAERVAPTPPKYNLLRYQEDYSVLGDGPRADWLDYLKFVPLGSKDLRLTVGGQVRERYEYKSDEVFGSGHPKSDGFYITRVRVHGDVQYKNWLRFFVEGKFAFSGDRDRPMPLLYEDHAAFENLFLDLTLAQSGKNRLIARVGRQELLYGKQRLVSSFDWANVMRTFDGARLLWTLEDGSGGTWQIDGWWTRLVRIEEKKFNDMDRNTQFFGVYATHTKANKKSGFDLYALGISADGRTNPNGQTGTDTRITLGGRAWCKQFTPWDFEAGGAYQVGRFAGEHVNAFMALAEIGYTLSQLRCQPRISFGYDYASGDDSPNDHHVDTFNQLFPLGHAYFGWIDVVGRQNIHAFNMRVTAKPLKNVLAIAQFSGFFLADKRDALYNAGAVAIRRDQTGSSGRCVGMELDFLLKWSINRHHSVLGGYSHFIPGSFIDNTGPGRDIDFVYVQYQFTF